MQRSLNVYGSWEDYVVKVETTPVPAHRCGSSSTKAGEGKSWDLGLGYEGALVAAREGWRQPLTEVERLATHVESKVDLDLFQTTFDSIRDVAGSEVDIDRYLTGEPECMIESIPLTISRHGRAVRLVVPISYSAGTDSAKVLRRGSAVVALADLLAKAQHPLEVWAAITLTTKHGKANSGKNTVRPDFVDLVRVQAADEPLDVARLLFILAHPAGFRRLGFRSIEQIEDRDLADAIGFSYGFPVGFHQDDLPDQVDNTFVLDHLNYSHTWDEDYCTTWITSVLDEVFG